MPSADGRLHVNATLFSHYGEGGDLSPSAR
jgi:hypothetical protein